MQAVSYEDRATSENVDMGSRAISFSVMRTRRISMDAAMRANGGDPDPASIGTVVVRGVPSWLARVWGRGTEAMTVRNVIFASESALRRIENGDALVLLTHEAVHVEQWRESGVIGFLVHYFGDYLRGRAIGLPHYAAYRAIRFEREAVEQSERP